MRKGDRTSGHKVRGFMETVSKKALKSKHPCSLCLQLLLERGEGEVLTTACLPRLFSYFNMMFYLKKNAYNAHNKYLLKVRKIQGILGPLLWYTG